jgi:hypothetical protein
MPVINRRPSFDEAATNECFNKLLEQIESLKSENAAFPRNWRNSYSPLEQAAYHLCQCRHLLEAVSRHSSVRDRSDTRIIKFGVSPE